MGISLSMIEKMKGLGLFGKSHISILDVGSSNLYSASADGVKDFLASYGVAATPEVEAFAERLAKGSAYDAVTGGTNGAFVGELFEKVGIKYNAIDIADGYRTTILDLNHDSAPPQFVDTFDLVLNFGTTEHLLNQYNAFKVMHDSTKVGGYIVNSLPCVGYSNHGYFTYTPRCLFDLAGYNEYEVIGFWFEGPGNANDLFAPIRDYLSYFPNLSRTLADRELTEAGQKIAKLDIPDVGLVVVYRKVKARPFLGALERSTSVGIVPVSVTSGYESDARRVSSRSQSAQNLALVRAAMLLSRIRALIRRILSIMRPDKPAAASAAKSDKNREVASGFRTVRHDDIPLTGKAEELRNRFVRHELGLEECLVFYDLVIKAHGHFPYDWEYQILLLGLKREPNRQDLVERLMVVKNNM